MTAVELEECIRELLPQISRLHLNREDIGVTHILNWGGFVNHSFTITAGRSKYHLKLSNEPYAIDGLRRWHQLHSVIEQRFRAPAVIDWVEFQEIGFAGLLMEHLEGRKADLPNCPALLRELVEWADHLHHDECLQRRLGADGSARTNLDYFADTYIERFTSDLELVAANALPFVPPSLLGWMEAEVERVGETARQVGSFHHRAVEAVHGDLTEANVVVTANGWYVVDWDDLTLGDPAEDFAVLLWPVLWNGGDWQTFLHPADDVAERLEVYFRAQLLDEVIDPLADYVEADAVPSHAAEVRITKRRRHEEALERYRSA